MEQMKNIEHKKEVKMQLDVEVFSRRPFPVHHLQSAASMNKEAIVDYRFISNFQGSRLRFIPLFSEGAPLC